MMRRKLPVLQQDEVAECGLACLAMIARYFGHDTDLAALRRRFTVSQHGMGLAQLMRISAQLGFQVRPLRVELEYLQKLSTPCILHWELNHFVVLKRASKNSVEIHDPSRGARTLSLAQAGQSFTGVALEFSPVEDFKVLNDRTSMPWRRLFGGIRGLGIAFSQLLALAIALELLTLVLPLVLQWVVDRVLPAEDVSLLTILSVALAGIVLAQAATQLMRAWIVSGVGATLNAHWVSKLFSHVMSLPMPFFEKRHVGDVMSRFASLQMIQQTLANSFVESLLDGLSVLLVLVLLGYYSLGMTLIVVLSFSIYAVLRAVFYRWSFSLAEERLVFTARQQSQMLEGVRGVLSVKLGGCEAQVCARVSNAAIEIANREAAIQRINAGLSASGKLVFGLQRALLIWFGGWLTIQGGFSVGKMVAFVAFADMFAQRAGAFIDRMVEFKMLDLHCERIAEFIVEMPERTAASAVYSGPPLTPVIEVNNLGFRYSEDAPWILRNCSFRIEAGESVAIIGPSGCGKTTLAKLLLGLLEPSEGSILIGGRDTRQLGPHATRALFAAVMQADTLFAGSMADNISFYAPEAKFERIQTAAALAQIHADIIAMPMGYETLVGDMGSVLSGGQKQRVILARALFRQAPILLLDEATSSLDIACERAINAAITALPMTRIVIAHRPDTIASADRVINLDSAGRQALERETQFLSAGAESSLRAPAKVTASYSPEVEVETTY